jgi:ribonuclease R
MNKNKKEQIYTGKYDSNSKGFGFVAVDGFARDLFIPQGCSASAMYGDTVEVRILKGSLNEYGLDDGRGHRAEAEVIRIVERGIKSIVGTYHALRKPVQKQYYRGAAADGEKGERGSEWKSTYVTYNIAGYVEPDHPKIPFKVDIPVKAKGNAMEGHKVVADITLYSGDGENPVGAISEVLGHVNDPGVDILSLVKSCGIPTEFPEKVLKEAEKLPDRIDVELVAAAAPQAAGNAAVPARRKDLRSIPTVTIDGEEIDPAKEYRLATIDYLLGGTDKMETFKKCRDINAPKDNNNNARFVIMDYFREMAKDGKEVDSQIEGRVIVK